MSTRGLFGLRKDGHDKTVYNHFDSYPEWLGRKFAEFINKNTDKLETLFENIVEVDTTKEPTKEQIAFCKEIGWYDEADFENNKVDWSSILCWSESLDEWQAAVNKERQLLINNYIWFIKDSLFCEYAYIFDIDRKTLEFYVGFQKVPDENNHYGINFDEDLKKYCGYQPCKCVAEFSLDELYNIDDVVKKMTVAAKKNYEENEEE